MGQVSLGRASGRIGDAKRPANDRVDADLGCSASLHVT